MNEDRIIAGPPPGVPPCPLNLDPKKWSKLCKLIPRDILDDLTAASPDELAKTIAQAELNIREQEAIMAKDTELDAAKIRVKDLAGPYKDAIKAQRAKQRVASYLRGDA